MATQPQSSADSNVASSHPIGRASISGAADTTESAAPAGACATGPEGFFGARFSLYPMSDRFVPIILHAIDGLRQTGLDVETDDVSTFLGGSQPAVFRALHRAFARAASVGEHVVMTVIFSYG